MRGGDGLVLFSPFSRCRIAPASGMSCTLGAIKFYDRRGPQDSIRQTKCLLMILTVTHTDVAPRKSSSISIAQRLFP